MSLTKVIGRQEIRYDLIGFEEPTFSGETALQSLSKRCEFLIKERGYDPWDRNQIVLFVQRPKPKRFWRRHSVTPGGTSTW